MTNVQTSPVGDSSCCTCARILSGPSIETPSYNINDEKKPFPASEPPRQLPCCSRLICSTCQQRNPRFQSYCPFCQISSDKTALPQGLRDPPGYEESDAARRKPTSSTATRYPEGTEQDLPPAYTVRPDAVPSDHGEASAQATDVIHHLRADDTIASLSLAYAVPSQILRAHNNIWTDGLLAARQTVRIPASHYRGPSLSDKPVESEEERAWKRALRRFMVESKCADYGLAELYLKNAKGDVGMACEAWRADEAWEREHPMEKRSGKSGRRANVGSSGGLTGQLGR